MSQPQLAPPLNPPTAREKVGMDAYGVVSLSAGIGSIGFLMGPALTVAFAWLCAVVAVVAGTKSDGSSTASAIGITIGALAAAGTLLTMLASSV